MRRLIALLLLTLIAATACEDPRFNPGGEFHANSGTLNFGAMGRTTGSSSTLAVPPAFATEQPEMAAAGYRPMSAQFYTIIKRTLDSTPLPCPTDVATIAAFSRHESHHGTYRAGGNRQTTLQADGTFSPPIIGIALNGRGVARIGDTDGGRLDGDATYDRAVGPFQFIPGTWNTYADPGMNPQRLSDAVIVAARYLCDLADNANLAAGTLPRSAIYSYNRSTSYVNKVYATLRWYKR